MNQQQASSRVKVSVPQVLVLAAQAASSKSSNNSWNKKWDKGPWDKGHWANRK